MELSSNLMELWNMEYKQHIHIRVHILMVSNFNFVIKEKQRKSVIIL